jgi:uncharacterized SAM-binding protein YcdF (DUF218 family)
MGFTLTKLISGLLTPSSLILLLLLLSEILSSSLTHKKSGQRLRRGLFIALFMITFLPISAWALLPLENACPPLIPDHVDGIILLGGDEEARISALRHQPVVLSSAQRYLRFAALARQYPDAKLVFTGGSGLIIPEKYQKEADVAREALDALGVNTNTMTFENQSRTTYENAVETAAIIHPDPQQNWLLVTNPRHMPRSMLVFQKAGWRVYPAPAGYLTDGRYLTLTHIGLAEHLLELADALHEYYGLLAYRLTGRTSRFWPSPVL